MTDPPSLAAAWLADLAARGIAVSLRNDRLWLQPRNAFKQLTDDELIFLRHHREAIKDAVRAGLPAPSLARPPVQNAASTAVQARMEPEAVCPYCHQSLARCAEMKADRHPTRRNLHYDDPEERKKRDEYATAVMLKMMRYGHY